MISDGMQFGWPSPAIPKLLNNTTTTIKFNNNEQIKSITNYYIVGNIFGLLISIVIFKKISRKLALIASSLPVLCGWLGILIAHTPWMIFLARFVGGVGRNMIYVVVPMYIGEIAEKNIRGVLGSFIYGSMNVGVILVYAFTPNFPFEFSPTIGLILITTQFILIYFIPESPYYLLMQNQTDKAKRNLEKLRQKHVDEEFEEITQHLINKKTNNNNTSELFKMSSNRKALSILMFLRFVQMFSGVSVMTMHIHSIFQKAGGNFKPETSALIYATLMLFSCFLTMTFMDRYGRKTLMIFSCITTAFILISQGFYLCFPSKNLMWLPLLLIITYIFTYRIGLGTVPMVMVSELFPTNVKVAGVVITDLIYSISSLLTNIMFQYTADTFGMYVPFFIFGGVCVVATLISVKYVPETRNKTLEEIQMLLKTKNIKCATDI